jgi:hypothetical protein
MPNHTAILQPVFALAAWTVCVLLLLAFRRVSTGLATKLSPTEYALGESPKVPAAVMLANRNYMNLLELPVLFYVGCLTAFATGAGTPALLTLAWAYVGLRVLHSLIHVSYNWVMHRFAVFAASNFVLAFFWVLLGVAVFGSGGLA